MKHLEYPGGGRLALREIRHLFLNQSWGRAFCRSMGLTGLTENTPSLLDTCGKWALLRCARVHELKIDAIRRVLLRTERNKMENTTCQVLLRAERINWVMQHAGFRYVMIGGCEHRVPLRLNQLE